MAKHESESTSGKRAVWEQEFEKQTGGGDESRFNRSGIEIKPLYTPDDWSTEQYDNSLGYPGQMPMTRGIYPSMHRGRSWTQTQLVGLSTPEQYNKRLREMIDAGVSAISIASCNSFLRGHDADEVPPELLGTCGTIINNVENLDAAFKDVPFEDMTLSAGDPTPFTQLAFMIALAKRRGADPSQLRGTSNQSDYLSHYVANHMFFRLSLPGSRRMLLDHIAYTNEHMPFWNPVSVVGQHIQQAGATPAETMGMTISSALQYAEDCIERGLDPDSFLPRFTFFFDVSISLFEEIAKFRAGRRLWARLVQKRFGAKDPRSLRFKFHAQTSGADLTRQQPMNNIARVAIQAIAGVMGGLQSLHTDGYDEALSSPTQDAARIAVSTQNILREEAGLADVIDPLGGSYYMETLTDQMEELILDVIHRIDDAGGMYAAVESGMVQRMIGDSAFAHQQKVDNGEQTIVGVNAYQSPENEDDRLTLARPDRELIDAHVARLRTYKTNRDQSAVRRALDDLARAGNDTDINVFKAVIDAAEAGITHGEICACLRQEMGDGRPLVAA
jgi:methylmalonyl-CoA mutase N-terminal domain/subunit